MITIEAANDMDVKLALVRSPILLAIKGFNEILKRNVDGLKHELKITKGGLP